MVSGRIHAIVEPPNGWSSSRSAFSAAEQGLGYIYQSRFTLLKVLDPSEDGVVFIERNDDVEFVATDKGVSLASLKHKAVGDRLVASAGPSPKRWATCRRRVVVDGDGHGLCSRSEDSLYALIVVVWVAKSESAQSRETSLATRCRARYGD